MKIQLRDYQTDCVHAVIKHFKGSQESAVLVLPTGAGKSLIIAQLAKLAKRPILIVTHVKELVEQNAQKIQQLGINVDIFSAGLKQRNHSAQITIGSIQSISANLEKFSQDYSLIIIDECHRVDWSDEKAKTATQYQKLIEFINSNNPVKVLGLTATPYRLNKGWVYKQHYRGFLRDVETPIFKHCIYEISIGQLIREKYLTPANIINIAFENYELFQNEENVNELLRKYPRVTQGICEDIVNKSAQKNGVIIFAATVEHAFEIQQYLSNEKTGLITGQTDLKKRDKIIKDFKANNIKYLINVSVLTTGFDAPHVDVIAILRATESVSLYQQMIGRGLRLYPDKKECLVLDYAGNNYDIHSPEIGSKKPNKDSKIVQVFCPICEFANQFWGLVDSDGDIMEHFGRRCMGMIENNEGETKQCDYRYVFKQCPTCMAENDIAARNCIKCSEKLIDPDDMLKNALKLKDHLVYRIQEIQIEKENTKIVFKYFDEDGQEIKEQYDFKYKKAITEFDKNIGRFMRSEHKKINNIKQIIDNDITKPDFIICKKSKYGLEILHRVYHYQGKIRKANQL
ncbi:MAG: DEAD/DEAH box helicase [Saccharospirillaceae bacterium]|nr:DEAD/DEAH box helicase [Pseudomonadales bacterium]NRB77741.1 DEAD/DEAH box helicase [Saccharospirillaceae bacterium]